MEKVVMWHPAKIPHSWFDSLSGARIFEVLRKNVLKKA